MGRIIKKICGDKVMWAFKGAERVGVRGCGSSHNETLFFSLPGTS